MAKAYKCDVCGALYTEYGHNDTEQVTTLMVRNMSYVGRGKADQDYDLCPECADSLMEWIRSRAEKPEGS